MKFNRIAYLLFLGFFATNTTIEGNMAAVQGNICNLDPIFNEATPYPVPRKVLESWGSGVAFDNATPYTLEEIAAAHAVINQLYLKKLAENPPQSAHAVITAGAPGAGKTLLMRDALQGSNCFYVDPDDVYLKELPMFQQALATGDGAPADRQAAYTKARPMSNFATQVTLAQLIRDKHSFYFGTTSSGATTAGFYAFLKQNGYKIEVLHVSAPAAVRWASIQERDKTFIQTTEQDVREKGLLFTQRINDTYFKYADTIKFYFRDDAKGPARLAAVWVRDQGVGSSLHVLKIIDIDAYKKLITLNEALAIEAGAPGFVKSVEAASDCIEAEFFQETAAAAKS